jgi:hypothetical protein
MSPRTELVSLLLRHQGTQVDDLDRFPLEERAAMLGFLTRYGYLTRSRGGRSPDLFGFTADDIYLITDRGRALLSEIAGA